MQFLWSFSTRNSVSVFKRPKISRLVHKFKLDLFLVHWHDVELNSRDCSAFCWISRCLMVSILPQSQEITFWWRKMTSHPNYSPPISRITLTDVPAYFFHIIKNLTINRFCKPQVQIYPFYCSWSFSTNLLFYRSFSWLFIFWPQ